jgi:predicted RNase H-like nuclease
MPLKNNKKTKGGIDERISILNKFIKNTEDILEKNYHQYKDEKIKRDDILDAISLALSVKKWSNNGKRKITQYPECDEKGLPFEIYY